MISAFYRFELTSEETLDKQAANTTSRAIAQDDTGEVDNTPPVNEQLYFSVCLIGVVELHAFRYGRPLASWERKRSPVDRNTIGSVTDRIWHRAELRVGREAGIIVGREVEVELSGTIGSPH